MSPIGFSEYLEFLMIEIAACNKHKLSRTELSGIHTSKLSAAPLSWLELAIDEIERQGWGQDGLKVGRSDIFILGAGLAKADDFREKHREKGFLDKLKTIPRSDWLALAAFIVSIFALFKA